MDLVYICRSGDNEELRYSIRSMVENFPHDNIWVVGGKPDWYIGNHIPIPQGRIKYENAQKNLKAIVESKEISEKFVIVNDDFYAIKPIKRVYTFVSGLLYDKLQSYSSRHPSSYYTSLIGLTYKRIKQLLGNDFVPMDYDIHVPMVYEKEKLKSLVKYTLLWRSLYGNIYDVPYKIMKDVKVYRYNREAALQEILDREVSYMSSDDESFEYLKEELLGKMFPNPSIYEG